LKGPSVEFVDLRYAFPIKKRRKGQKAEVVTLEALKTLTAKFQPGKLTAIMGPSGSGKTTLLNILAGRAGKASIAGAELTGEISLDGRVIDPIKERDEFAYVMSEDALFATLTPRESLMYAARLRLPHVTQAERSEKVEKLISALKISNCADTLIGDERTKGVSSGERKRTAVGCELVHDPALVLLDEPTSGLDSYTAYELVDNLRLIANQGRSVVTTIHQPRSEIFDLFHDVVFLASGSIIYQGPAKKVREFFASAGYVCPDKHNPADFVMHLLQTLSAEELEEIVNKRDLSNIKLTIGLEKKEALKNPPKPSEVHRATLSQQTRILLGREIKNTFRNKEIMGMRFGAEIIMSLLFGGVFFQVGKASSLTSPDYLDSQVMSYVGAVTFVCIQAMFANVQPILIAFPKERPIFIREYSGGYYSAAVYFLCKSLVEIPLLAVQSALATVILYFMMGFSGNYPLFFLGNYLIGLASASLAVALTSRVAQMKTALELSPLVFVPQIFFSGVFVRIEQIPAVLRWIQYIIPLKYGVNIVYLAEINQSKYFWAPETLSQNVILTNGLWWYILVLLGLFLVFRMIGLLSLVQKAKSTVF
jgi:ABC-type multidrug transport system ATPase subunit/ABC-type multidrug transport system permease subunit